MYMYVQLLAMYAIHQLVDLSNAAMSCYLIAVNSHAYAQILILHSHVVP